MELRTEYSSQSFFSLFSLDTVLLCSSGWPRICDLIDSGSLVLETNVYHNTSLNLCFGFHKGFKVPKTLESNCCQQHDYEGPIPHVTICLEYCGPLSHLMILLGLLSMRLIQFPCKYQLAQRIEVYLLNHKSIGNGSSLLIFCKMEANTKVTAPKHVKINTQSQQLAFG